MATTLPQIHVFDKSDYSKHRLVTLPARSLPELAPNSLRLRTRILGQTTNNLTYALLGFALGWWDIYPQPEDTPAPYNDRATYACIAGWGYAEVLESTVPGIEKGQSVYGYLSISTVPFDVSVERAPGLDDDSQIVVTSPHRQHLWLVYNRLRLCAPLAQLEQEKTADSLGWDALMNVLFGTGFNLSTFGFAWDEQRRIHPWGEGAWTAEDADLNDAAVFILNASGKTAMSFAWALRHARPSEYQPRTIVGVCSARSKDLVQNSGFYDTVVLGSEADATRDLVQQMEQAPKRLVLLDFGARAGTMASFSSALSAPEANLPPLARLVIGGDNTPKSAAELAAARAAQAEKVPSVQVNANSLREKGIAVGGKKYLEEFEEAWDGFKKAGALPGVKLVWGEGMERWEEGWEKLCKDQVGGGEGWVIRL